MRVGLTGGIGSGKSAVARLFSDWGAVVIDADVLAHDVVAGGTPGLAEIGRIWPQVIGSQGSLDRAALSRIVFGDAAAREQLNGIIHPRVRAGAAALEAAAAPGSIVVHVVPLLFEGDYWKTCDANVLVVAPAAVRVARVVARDGWSVADIQARMAAQIDPARAAGMADFVIDNDGDLATLEQRARRVYAALERPAA
ncbi:MAG: dephospho-CoA kinase [Candidatus Velthaea sp.]|jgi:dephospho-CoA kinase